MRRRDFLKIAPIGAAAAVVAPCILAQAEEEISYPISVKRKGLITNMDMSDTDWQFIESRQFQIEEIARAFNYPIEILNEPTCIYK